MRNSNPYFFCDDKAAPQVGLHSFFFHHRSFVTRNKADIQCFSYDRAGGVRAKLCFSINNNEAISLPSSPFGSIDLADQFTYGGLKSFVIHTIEQLQAKGIRQIVIKSFPACYHPPHFRILDRIFKNTGFTIAYTEITQYLDLNIPFFQTLNPEERRYLNYATSHQFTFKLLTLNNLSECYELIKESRQHKGYPVTMRLEELRDTIGQFPGRYLIFGLFDRSALIATSICIRVNNQILYNFYHGDRLSYRKHSPVVPLVRQLYLLAKHEGFKILDLGVSTEKGTINTGLFRFKKHMGALPSEKPVYTLNL